jgi:hypothetical protein
VYTLGVIAYELLVGKLPYGDAAESMPKLLHAVRTHDIVLPELGGDLDIVLVKALAAEPESRYASAAALADDLRRVLADEPIAARLESLGTQVLRFARKNRALAATATALLVAILAGGVTTTVLLVRANARNRALEREKARVDLKVDPTRAVATLEPLGESDGEAQDLIRIARGRGVARAVIPAHGTEVRSVSFAPDDGGLATVGYDHVVHLWDAGSGRVRGKVRAGEQVTYAWSTRRRRRRRSGRSMGPRSPC